MKKVYLAFDYIRQEEPMAIKKIAIECKNMEELRDVASDAYDYDKVQNLEIIENGNPADGATIISDLDYWNYVFSNSLA